MRGSDDYRLSASAFYGVSIVTPHPLFGREGKCFLRLRERRLSVSKQATSKQHASNRQATSKQQVSNKQATSKQQENSATNLYHLGVPTTTHATINKQ